ncbi:penicillin amidase family protein [Pseudomonas syringae pv. actinidiae ICMP 19071]|nr:penicillin amidase family protein [Pseudomonas syringae pv. actinidiae ICMP 19071]EPM77862.1 penicillin amidase family protein [Pseudomonas syringae pv. actinidiae ICMP 19072]
MSRALPGFLFAGLSVAVVLPAQALVAHEQKTAGA